MATIDWSLDWKFKKCIEGIEGDAINVDLPYDAMFYEKRTYATSNGDKTGYYPGGAYVYEKDFELAKENENCQKLIKAEGMPISDVRITTKSIRPAVVEVLCNYENAKVEIFDRNNHLVAYVFLSANNRTEY